MSKSKKQQEKSDVDVSETVETSSEVHHDVVNMPVPVAVGNLTTPLYFNTNLTEWPQDSVFYVMASNGLFKCRNHPFFISCVKTDRFPTELKPCEQSLSLRYPKIPKAMFQKVVGFFSKVYDK